MVLLLSWLTPHAAKAQSPAAVVTGQYNRARTSSNQYETILTPDNVSSGSFGYLFSQPVDANIFAQPLYVPNLRINGAPHNTVFVATLNNSVYAFDADTVQPALWHTTMGTPVNIGTTSQPVVGILSTPVIDQALNLMFVVTYTSENSTLVYRLHALNILTGADTASVVIQGAVPGTGDDSQNTPCAAWDNSPVGPPCIPFKANELFQRPALLEGLNRATIYIAFGCLNGQEQTTPYHGWLIAYTYANGTFQQSFIFNTTAYASQDHPDCTSGSNQCGHGSGIWMSGRGPAIDATGVYVATGNGGFGPDGGNWGESVLRLNGAGKVMDYFTPQNYLALNDDDLDLCDGGVILFTSPNDDVPNLILVAGKSGGINLMNRASLGGLRSGNAGSLQNFTATTNGCGNGPGRNGCYDFHSPALWQRPAGQTVLYVWAHGDVLRAWDFQSRGSFFKLDPNQGSVVATGYPGAGLAVSANGNSNGIVWAIVPGVGAQSQAVLYAYNALNVSTPLWSSGEYWFATKFNIPTIANGKVYVPTSAATSPMPYSPALQIYGLCGACASSSPAATKAPRK